MEQKNLKNIYLCKCYSKKTGNHNHMFNTCLQSKTSVSACMLITELSNYPPHFYTVPCSLKMIKKFTDTVMWVFITLAKKILKSGLKVK